MKTSKEVSLTNYNIVKETLLKALEREGLLKEGVKAEDISADYAIILVKPGVLGSLWDKIRGYSSDDKAEYFKVIKDV